MGMEWDSVVYWLVVWIIFYFSIIYGNSNPNWLIFFRGVETTNQYSRLSITHLWTHPGKKWWSTGRPLAAWCVEFPGGVGLVFWVVFSVRRVATWIPFDGHFHWFSMFFWWRIWTCRRCCSKSGPLRRLEDSNSYLTWQLLYYSHGNRCLAQLGCLDFPQTNFIATTKTMEKLQ